MKNNNKIDKEHMNKRYTDNNNTSYEIELNRKIFV